MTMLLLINTFFFILAGEVSAPPLTSDTVSQSPSGQPVFPGLLTVSETTIEFGDVFQGNIASKEVVFTNLGDQAIRLTELVGDCRCKSSLVGSDLLQPGEKTRVRIEYDPDGVIGKDERRITVYTDINEPRNWIDLTIRATVKSVLVIQPSHVYFKNVRWGEASTEEVIIKRPEGMKVNLISVEVGNGAFTASFEPVFPEQTLDSEGKLVSNQADHWKVMLSLPGTVQPGRITGELILTTDFDPQKTMRIPVLGYVKGPITINPTQIYFGAMKAGEIREKTLMLGSNEATDMETPVISCDAGNISWVVEEKKVKKEYLIRVTLKTEPESSGKISGILGIETNVEVQPRIEVPIFAYILQDAPETGKPPKTPEN